MVVEQAARLRNEVATRVSRPGETKADLNYLPSMSESSNEQNDQSQTKGDDDSAGISDEQLPEDLQPSEDNPLAEPLTEEEAPDDIDDLDMMGGSSGDSDEDSDGDSEDKDSSGESAEDDGED